MTNLVDKAIDQTLGHEGGYSNHPADRGGPTRWGITQATARAYGYKGDMRHYPRETAIAVYKAKYWERPGFGHVAKRSEHVAIELFDTGVNMGQEIASKFLQRCLNALNNDEKDYPNIKEDGDIGPETLAMLDHFLDKRGETGEIVLLTMLNSLQGARYIDIAQNNEKQEAFIYGWFRTRVEMP